MKKQLCLLIMCMPFIIMAQSSATDGIQWTTGLSWEQVKQKAKSENKYIFLDCYTTWCGPCKWMDKEVYTNDTVGDFFNSKFISVKVQMDQTNNDNALIKNWYDDAALINKRYMVPGYPSFLFFSPTGEIIDKETGAKNSRELISIAEEVFKPGKVFKDVYPEYESFLEAYQRGEIQYEKIPEMVLVGKQLGDTIYRQWVGLHEKYVSGLRKKDRYTKANIEFWSKLTLGSRDKLVQFFFKDGRMIDKIMNQKGYAAKQVDKCIQTFITSPFIDDQLKDPIAKSGIKAINTTTGLQVSGAIIYDEADWKKLKKLIQSEFDSYYAKRNLSRAKAIWYEKNNNWIAFANASLDALKTCPPDFEDWLEVWNMNHIGWMVFANITDADIIKETLKWMEKLIEPCSRLYPKSADHLDTYANLLYKIGKTDEAIRWQEKAVAIDTKNKGKQMALQQMKKGGVTYGIKPLLARK